jgi:hypothetical protein
LLRWVWGPEWRGDPATPAWFYGALTFIALVTGVCLILIIVMAYVPPKGGTPEQIPEAFWGGFGAIGGLMGGKRATKPPTAN